MFTLDVRDEDALKTTIARMVGRFGRLDILVNNAGLFRGGSILSMAREDWQDVVGAHLTGSFPCAKHAATRMVAQGRGKVVNIGSIYALFGPPDFPDYAAAKAGVL